MKEISIDKNYLIDILQNLVSIDSVNPTLVEGGAGEKEISNYLFSELAKLGLEVVQDEAAPNRPNVIATLPGSDGSPALILNGHMDTVGVENMGIDPFDPWIKDGKLHGRGALDMKGGIACFVAATKGILDSGVKLKGDLILACSVDEEYASIGMDSLRNKVKAKAGIITEPSCLEIITAHKGFSWIEIETTGRAVHGSMHDVGIDAIVHMGKVLEQIQLLNQSVYPGIKHELLGSPSIHASLINGGKELSTYPDRCKLQMERRNLPHETHADVQREVDSVLEILRENHPYFNAKGEVFLTRGGSDLPHDLPVISTLARQFERHTGVKPDHKGWAAWPEAGLLTEAGIPTVLFGPSGHDPHAPVEYVTIDSLETCTKIVANTIMDFCGYE